MSIIPQNPTPSNPENAPLAPNFDDQVREFWIKYSRIIYLVVGLALAVVLLKSGYAIYLDKREQSIAADYNRASTNDQLRTFANEHANHPLGGVAYLRLADDAYSNNKYSDAVALYDKASSALTEGAFAGRARLGAALCRILAGQNADGEAALKRIANDTTQLKTVRAEAAYHLGVIASGANRADEAGKFFEQAASIDPTSSWAQRALMEKR